MTDLRHIDVFDAETRLPRMCAEQCSTCIFRPGNPMDLRPGRLRDITRSALRADSFIVCHSTLPGPQQVAPPAICRGFADRYSTNLLRIWGRLGGFVDVDLPAPGGTS
jgi:hypothetical protein